MKLGDLDPQVLVSALAKEATIASENARPGTNDFAVKMSIARTLTHLAIALNTAIKHDLDLRAAHAPDSSST